MYATAISAPRWCATISSPLAAERRRAAKLPPACDALASWDLKVDLDSRGAHLFHLFAENGGLKFKVPFNPADPVRTPNTLDVADPAVLEALEKAVDKLANCRSRSMPGWATCSASRAGGQRIPIHGGAGPEGVFNVITGRELEARAGLDQHPARRELDHDGGVHPTRAR